MSKFARKERPPAGYELIESTLNALEIELRESKFWDVVGMFVPSGSGLHGLSSYPVNENHEGKRKNESIWPVFQINWQRSRYVFDMFYVYKQISREVLDYCIRNKLVDGGLMAKWKKPGYERLCSTYVINTKNYKFGTVSICRVSLSSPTYGHVQIRKSTHFPNSLILFCVGLDLRFPCCPG
ncbi:unnamed protein product [Discosporangium mesarthrocarpum]